MYDISRRLGPDELKKQSRNIGKNELIQIVAEYSDHFVGILNDARQFVYINEAYFKNNAHLADLIGYRPGEVFKCIHSEEHSAGCGNSESCRFCYAGNTILQTIFKDEKVINQGRMLVTLDNRISAVDFEVKTVPFRMENERFILFFLTDTSRIKQSELIERAFFHDVLNSSNVLTSLVSISKISSEYIENADRIIESSITDIIEQIYFFKKLKNSEAGTFHPDFEVIDLLEEIEALVNTVKNTSWVEGIELELSTAGLGEELKTDRIIFRRIILNLLKNAFEASRPGDEVKLAIYLRDDYIEIHVNNPAVMPEEVRMQVFQRSFSTKGEGRGIGTYSIKLFTENFLKGRVAFTSEEGRGTTFVLTLPRQ